MADLQDGESVEMQGSGAKPYVLKNIGGVYSCTCPAWRNQSAPIERRTCKHLRKLRGEQAERERLGTELAPRLAASAAKKEGPPLLLAQTWDNTTDLTDWWMSEKLDGVRAFWDGEQWKEVRFLVFDAPGCDGGFEVRLEYLAEAIRAKRQSYAQLHEHQRCRGLSQIREELARVEALGGEGLMLRQPGSAYEIGRSFTLLKVKTFRDAEAIVLGHQPGKRRFKGLKPMRRLREQGMALPCGISSSSRANPASSGRSPWTAAR